MTAVRSKLFSSCLQRRRCLPERRRGEKQQRTGALSTSWLSLEFSLIILQLTGYLSSRSRHRGENSPLFESRKHQSLKNKTNKWGEKRQPVLFEWEWGILLQLKINFYKVYQINMRRYICHTQSSWNHKHQGILKPQLNWNDRADGNIHLWLQ